VTGRARVEALHAIGAQLGLTVDLSLARVIALRDSAGRVVARVPKDTLPGPSGGLDALRRVVVAACADRLPDTTDTWGD
jgi:hypothetical protein